MRFELVNVIGKPVCDNLSACLGLAAAYRQRVKDADPEKRAPFPYTLYGFDALNNEALYFEENAALDFLESILNCEYFHHVYDGFSGPELL